MNHTPFGGVGVALVTPFLDDGALDLTAFEQHVEFQIQGGVDFLVPCGTTGESATLDDGEQRVLIETAVAVASGRVPVMAGAGSNDTLHACHLARAAAAAGADGILSVSPYYNRPNGAGLVQHYEALAQAAGIGVMVYNVPGRTGVNISPRILFRLAEVEGVVGVKEASGDVEQVMTILQGRPDDFLVLSGEDTLTLPLMAAGAEGVISVVANEAPAGMARLATAARAGDLTAARREHFRWFPLMQANFFDTNPVPVKTALELMDRMAARFRLPLAPMDDLNLDRLAEALDAVGLLP